MKFVFFSLFICLQYFALGQTALSLIPDIGQFDESSSQEFIFTPNLKKFKSDLKGAPRTDVVDEEWVKMSLPFADGTFHEVEVAEAPVVAKKIYDKYPENRSYKIKGVKDKFISGRMSITPRGISAILYTKTGNVFIEPHKGDSHKVYDFDRSVLESFVCGTDHSKFKNKKGSTSRASYGSDERKYTIAIASTGEFSAKHGNNLANINGIINDYLTLLNTLYERDLAVTFELAANNDNIIFFDPNTDGLDPSNSSTKLNTAQSVINSGIGNSNYDIGHVFHEIAPPSGGWWGSGVASLGVVCSSSSKARGWSGCGGSYPNSFWMGIFAHEVGHQFDATHTFYGTAANCGGSQRSIGNGVEPGSGNSMMSYEGSCGQYGSCNDQNITPYSGFYYFHGHSIHQIQSFVSGTANCYTSTSSGNSPPVITMPTGKTIPTGTPFYLSATVTDPDGDPLLLAWEEVDTDNLNLSCPNGDPNDAATSTAAPLFRSFDPSEGGNFRNFPQLSDILDDVQTMGEILPEVGRTIDMRFTARGTDANGISGVSYEDVTITVAGNSGPFEITTANTPEGYLAGASVTVNWLVNNTNDSPVSCNNVNILFSNDGGNSFPITLASSTPNDGTHAVTMPANGTVTGRIKIEAVNNIFFTINKADISIISTCTTNSSAIINDADVVADAGDPSLNLALLIGDEISSVSGDISATDPSSNLIGKNSSTGSCIAFGNIPGYDTYLLTATETDVYNFNSSGSGFQEVVNIYQDAYIPPATSCQNWLTSNFSYSPIIFTNPISVSLTEGDVIEMVVSGFNTLDIGSYTVNFSSNGSGALINADIIPPGFVYKFVIYNSAGYIIAIEDIADLTNGDLYYDDIYMVKGLLVISTANLSPYINNLFTILQSDVLTGEICGEFSSNDVSVTINGCNSGTKIVTSLLDDGSMGTLRYKVENACAGDVIQFDPSLINSTLLMEDEIIVDQNVSVSGFGINNFTISGNNLTRIFKINSGVNATISNLALINGYELNNGGAFINNGSVALNNVKLEGNKNGVLSEAFTNFGSISIENTVNIKE